jgi:CDP-glucose 4,6-dehydratase
MENMGIELLFGSVYKNKRVLVTGHTGFKGSWLVQWLKLLGASVAGYSLEPDTVPSHYSLLELDIESQIGDINHFEDLNSFIRRFQPEIVFHLAAQPLVLESYNNPQYTYQTNVMGTLNVLESCRIYNCVKSIVVVTTDKVYENNEWHWAYRENDRLGGFDPYSSSKACVEILCNSYRNSFFNNSGLLLATARAGNVIGGGDWAAYRLIPDIIKTMYADEKLQIRNPESIRPWQHVLEPLSGYLLLGKELIERKTEFADSWNFGPEHQNCVSVSKLIELIKKNGGDLNLEIIPGKQHEAAFLKLDCAKATQLLKWKPIWDISQTIDITVQWYKSFYQKHEILTCSNIEKYVTDAKNAGLIWTE